MSAIRSSTSVNPIVFLICMLCLAYPPLGCALVGVHAFSATPPSGLVCGAQYRQYKTCDYIVQYLLKFLEPKKAILWALLFLLWRMHEKRPLSTYRRWCRITTAGVSKYPLYILCPTNPLTLSSSDNLSLSVFTSRQHS